MINILHLIWIVPLSMIAGVCSFIVVSCATIGKISGEEKEEIEKYIKENEYDN